MKKIKLFIIAFISLAATNLIAQETNTEKLIIPLSNPGSPGFLEVGGVNCSIIISGYNGDEVIVEAETKSKVTEVTETKNGMKKIKSSSMSIEAEERNNRVEISSGFNRNGVIFRIKVPHNFSLDLSTVNRSEIKVENIKGEVNASNVNGPITLTNISGSVSANSVNKPITVVFDEVTPDLPMAFSSMNGDIDITFPANIKANLKMKNTQGDILTDFDIELSKERKVNNERNEKGVYKVSIDEWVYGKVNGGGPEYSFKNFNGDIIIRKK